MKTNDSHQKKPSAGSRAEIKYALHLARQNPLVVFGAAIAVSSILLGLFSGYLVNPNSWQKQDLAIRFCWNNPIIDWHLPSVFACPGTTVYPLGTDSYGRNLLNMIILALPLDLEISFTIVAAAALMGLSIGAVAAYVGGWLDELLLRITDVFFSMPGLSLAIVFVTVFSRNLFFLTIAVLITWWPVYVRLIRSQVLSEKGKLYVDAEKSIGASGPRILFLHIIPNAIYPVVVQATLDVGGVILVFSSLMFLGFSPSPLLPELGNLVQSGISNVFIAPWLIIFPGLTILLVTLGFSLLGDGLRDILDPRLRR
jgi:peptide/nickel transport system permease protein